MSLAPDDQRHLRSAHGYVELGMFEDANKELEEIGPSCRHAPKALATRLLIYHGLAEWELMAVVAGKLTEWNPAEPEYFVDFAYATRRSESIQEAYAILERAAELHPHNATIQFNLACYEAQMGHVREAKERLETATKIDEKFNLLALDDPDLEPIWASLSA